MGNRSGLAVVGLIVVALAWIAVTSLLKGVVRAASWTLANVAGLSRRPRAAAVVAAVPAAAVAVATAGTVLLTVVAAALPVAFVIACGAWAAVLTWRRLHAARRAWLRRWLRWTPDALAAATIWAGVLVLADRSRVTAQPVAGVLFPPAVWGSLRIWRAMQGSRRLPVRAVADITLSLLLGAEVVLFLVWLANLLGLSRPEVVALRALLHQAGSAADVPAWVWAGLYGFLAALAVAFAAWPPRLAKVMGWLRRLRVVLLATAARRTLTGVHIGLMAVVLVGWATPVALTATFRRQLPAVYAVAVQRDLVSQGEIAAYRQIRQTFTATQSPALASLVADIHDTSGAPAGADRATSVEADLARRLGELQAVALGLEARGAWQAAAEAGQAGEAAAKQAGLGAPVHGEADLDGRLGQVEGERSADDDAAKRAELAGDLAAAMIASTISIPHLSDGEIVQVVREYLSGLIEGSPLRDVFAAWARRLPGSQPPPEAEAMVVPEADPLEHAAAAELSAAFTGQGLADPVTDPRAHDPAVARALRETALAAAVDMVNQARYLQRSSGPCAGCTRPEKPGDSQVGPPEEDGGGGE